MRRMELRYNGYDLLMETYSSMNELKEVNMTRPPTRVHFCDEDYFLPNVSNTSASRSFSGFDTQEELFACLDGKIEDLSALDQLKRMTASANRVAQRTRMVVADDGDDLDPLLYRRRERKFWSSTVRDPRPNKTVKIFVDSGVPSSVEGWKLQKAGEIIARLVMTLEDNRTPVDLSTLTCNFSEKKGLFLVVDVKPPNRRVDPGRLLFSTSPMFSRGAKFGWIAKVAPPGNLFSLMGHSFSVEISNEEERRKMVADLTGYPDAKLLTCRDLVKSVSWSMTHEEQDRIVDRLITKYFKD